MRHALDDSGCRVEAGADAPDQAFCPHCGGHVILRRRRRSRLPGDVTYFWRHEDHANASCPARFRAGYAKRRDEEL